MNKNYLKTIFVLISVTALVVFFQNCGNINVKPPSESLASNAKAGVGYFCIPQGYTLETFFVTNLNTKATADGLFKDTDGDGLSDVEEQALGFNPNKRRSGGKVLDAICNDLNYGPDCAKFTLECDPSQDAFGLNECDKMALNVNLNIQVGAGIDSDKDGIPDYLEIRIHSFPNLADSNTDLDFDLINNIGEAERGSSARDSNKNIKDENLVNISKRKIANTTDCANGEYWQFTVNNLPTIAIDAFVDDELSAINLSHGVNENVIQTFLKMKPVNGANGNAKVFSGVQLIKYDFNNVDKDFIFDQTQLIPSGEVGQ